MNIQDIRIENLTRFINKIGSAAKIGKEYEGISASYLSQLINKHRPFSEKSARKIEQVCSMLPFPLDTLTANQERAEYGAIVPDRLETQVILAMRQMDEATKHQLKNNLLKSTRLINRRLAVFYA
ncbi:MAG: hypothetical protein WBP13_00645 [Methylophilaceae bacterium]